MKIPSTFSFAVFLLSFICISSTLSAQILEQNFNNLSSLSEFQGNPPNVGQVDRINLSTTPEGDSIFSLGSDGPDKYLEIEKRGRRMRYFDRFTGLNQEEFLKISFTFEVTAADRESKIAAVFVGEDFSNSSITPNIEKRWGQIGIYASSNNGFYLTNEKYRPSILNQGENPNYVSTLSSSFTGEQKITIVMSDSDDSSPYAYLGPNGNPKLLLGNQIHVWVGETLVIQDDYYDSYMNRENVEGDPGINSFRFFLWNNLLNASAKLDDLLITDDFEVVPLSDIEDLPVVLTSFTVKKSGKEVKLEWQTASEKNSSHFEVERSLDGQEFEKIGTISAAGNSNTELNYTYLDKEAHFKFAGTVFYRLQQVDFDGAMEYSPVTKVELPAISTTLRRVFPNPFDEELNIGLFSDKTLTINFRLLNTQGKVVLEKTRRVESAGQEQLFRLVNPGSLQSGVYILEVETGGETHRYRVMKL